MAFCFARSGADQGFAAQWPRHLPGLRQLQLIPLHEN